ncbi:MAG: 1-deoxy-D-xylulose-5-phosphate reductoisomerase [Oscillospiraceae bacterium]|nr:1-deoxy-D-xylulose-5-phosphate reductoisomerase [Oscillospiraceae bacterium]
MSVKRINLLGASGSIGTQVQDVCRMYPDRLAINACAVNTNVEALSGCVREFGVKKACVADESSYNAARDALFGTGCEVYAGSEGLCRLAADTDGDMTVDSVVGFAGLAPADAAIRSGIPLALANKESLVAGGSYIMGLAKSRNVDIIPIDSEHSAILQCLMSATEQDRHTQLKSIILTASGGPFAGKKRGELENVTPADALAHPNWDMGVRITTDSATMMNKGFELIEACHLFGVTPDKVNVVVHRQSIIHSAVEFSDNAVIAQLGVPDMRIPIQYALFFPERRPSPARALSLTDIGTMTFEKPDTETFTCLKAAMTAAERLDTTAGAIINAADEELVKQFHAGRIRFTDIFDGVCAALENIPAERADSLSVIEKADRAAREYCKG